MKENWIRPEINQMNISETKNVCDCGASYARNANNQHYCHRDKLWHANGCGSLQVGHTHAGSCNNKSEHGWDGESHKSSCCCSNYQTSVNPELSA